MIRRGLALQKAFSFMVSTAGWWLLPLAGRWTSTEFMPIDALGPAIQILFDALKETASRRD
jgi:hypothetical protein